MPRNSFAFAAVATLVAVSVWPYGLYAQDAAEPPPEDKLIVEQDRGQKLSAELIGMDVVHPDEGTIGQIESLLFDDEDQIVGGVVSVGGFLGIGAKSVALSWETFDVRERERVAYIDLSREQLEAAPGFKDRDTIRAERAAEQARQEQMRQQQLRQQQQMQQQQQN